MNSLKGLENHPLMDTLNFGYTDVLDLAPIKGLEALRSLDFSCTQVKNVDALKDLPELEYVNMGSSLVRSIAALSGKPKLVSLYCYNTPMRKEDIDAFVRDNSTCQVDFY